MKDIFTTPADVLVCPTNGQGIMGAGLARQFKERYPGLKTAYAQACRRGEQEPGHLFFWQGEEIVCCLPTKRAWAEPSLLGDVYAGLYALAQIQHTYGLLIALPPVGCGLGGLNWRHDVRPFVLQYFDLGKTVLTFDAGE